VFFYFDFLRVDTSIPVGGLRMGFCISGTSTDLLQHLLLVLVLIVLKNLTHLYIAWLVLLIVRYPFIHYVMANQLELSFISSTLCKCCNCKNPVEERFGLGYEPTPQLFQFS
jgi:hypothetical protein